MVGNENWGKGEEGEKGIRKMRERMTGEQANREKGANGEKMNRVKGAKGNDDGK